jgi:Fic family protein
LWSVCRGLARRRDEYYARLENADEPRRGDLDGRGNLSEEGLRRWCGFFLDVCDDQVSFMSRMLDLDEMKTRIRALIEFRAASDKALRAEAVVPLHYLFAAGPLARGELKQLTGLGDRTAQALLSRLLATGLVESDSSLGPVSFGMPLDALPFLFPDLYPEAAARQD